MSTYTFTFPPFLVPQLLWSADADRKQQCSFKGKDPQVSQACRQPGLEEGWWVIDLGPGPRQRVGAAVGERV